MHRSFALRRLGDRPGLVGRGTTLAVVAGLIAGATPSAGVPENAARVLPTLAGEHAAGPLVVTHGGVGSKPHLADGTERAAQAGLAKLAAGGGSLDAAIAGTVVMEDDPRFNAGTGANIRLDGKTIQMDAALMTSNGRFAAVGVIERVRNPILVVRRVLDTPHLFLAGEGATRFAHRMGFEDVVPTCPEAEAKYAERLATLTALAARTDTTIFDWRGHWNFPRPIPEAILEWGRHGDTVGTVARDGAGTFAATLSTGGTSITLSGRVGDVPIYGAGLFAGPHGAVACTGDGERIIERFLARSVYEEMERGVPAREAIRAAVEAFPPGVAVGLIAVDANGWGVAATDSMAFGVAPR